MLKKAFLLSILYFSFALIFTACCNCVPGSDFNVRYTNFSAHNLSYTDTLGDIRIVSDSSTDYRYRHFLLNLHLDYELLAANNPGFFNTAYACKCDFENNYTAVNAVANIRVFTLNPYDAVHDAYSDVTAYFGSVFYDTSTRSQRIDSLQPSLLLGKFRGNRPSFDDYFFLATRPSIPGNHQFKVVIAFKDGSTFEDTTAVVQF